MEEDKSHNKKISFIAEWEEDSELNFKPTKKEVFSFEFSREWEQVNDLDYYVDDGLGLPDTIVEPIVVTLPTPNFKVLCVSVVTGTAEVVLSLSASVIAEVDINVIRANGLSVDDTVRSGDKSVTLLATVNNIPPKVHEASNATLSKGDYVSNKICGVLGFGEKEHNCNEASLFDGEEVNNNVIHFNSLLIDGQHKSEHSIFDGEETASDKILSLYSYPPRSDCAKASKWQLAEEIKRQWCDDFDLGVPTRNGWCDLFENAEKASGIRPPIKPPVIIPPIERLDPSLNIKVLWSNLADLEFVRIELEALIIMNEITMKHTAGDGTVTELDPVGLSIASNRDSFAWSVTVELYGDLIPQMISGNGDFTINVNGNEWVVKSFKYDRKADNGFSCMMVSETQKLGSPSAKKIDVVIDAPISALAMVTNLAQASGINVIDNSFIDWVVHEDTAQFIEQEPKNIIAEVVKAVGASMTPTLDGKSLILQPRYKVSFDKLVDLADEDCDVLLNPDFVVQSSGENINADQFNNVLIQGTVRNPADTGGGVVTRCIVDGSGGTNEANGITSPLQQDHNANAELARNIFSESGGKNVSTLLSGIDGNLAKSGDIIRVTGATPKTGICLGNTISIHEDTMPLQSISIEFPLEVYA